MTGRTNTGGGSAFAVIDISYPEGAACTCSNGVRTMQAKDTSGHWMFQIPRAGEWTVTVENESSSKSETVNITESRAYSLDFKFELILFNNGSYAPETGGWTGGGLGGSSTGGVQSNKLYALGYTGSSAKDGEGFFYTNQKVDLTPYSTLHFIVDSTTGNLEKFVGYGTTQMDQSGRASAAPESSTPTECTVNIQSVSGAYYINGTAVGAGRQNYLYVSKVWLT